MGGGGTAAWYMASMPSSFLRVASLAASVAMLPSLACGQSAQPPAPQVADAPIDFSEQAKALYRLVACTGDALPRRTGRKDRRRLLRAPEARRSRRPASTPAGASAFIAKLRPADLPTTVVYPFGGGDLLTALTVYPDARDVTTLSLEHAGDPRRLPDLADARGSPRAWS